MATILNITSIIIIVFGVLQIILFFKLWKMTNDVTHIKEIITPKSDSEVDNAKIELLLDNKEKAVSMFKREFIIEVMNLYQSVKTTFDKDSVYSKEFASIEKNSKKRMGEISSFIDFEKYSTFEKAKNIFG